MISSAHPKVTPDLQRMARTWTALDPFAQRPGLVRPILPEAHLDMVDLDYSFEPTWQEPRAFSRWLNRAARAKPV